jgi:hypothetical protein
MTDFHTRLFEAQTKTRLMFGFEDAFAASEDFLWRMGTGNEAQPVSQTGPWLPEQPEGIITIKDDTWKKLLIEWGKLTQNAMNVALVSVLTEQMCGGMASDKLLETYRMLWLHVSRLLRVGLIEIVHGKSNDLHTAFACSALMWVPVFISEVPTSTFVALLPVETDRCETYLRMPARVAMGQRGRVFTCVAEAAELLGQRADGPFVVQAEFNLNAVVDAYRATVQDSLPSLDRPLLNVDLDTRFKHNVKAAMASAATDMAQFFSKQEARARAPQGSQGQQRNSSQSGGCAGMVLLAILAALLVI